MPWHLPRLNTSPKSLPPNKQAGTAPVPAPVAVTVNRWRKLLLPSADSPAYENAVRLLEAGQWENAIAAFERIVARAKRSGPLTGELARFYLCEAHLGFALSTFDAAPNDAGVAEKAITHLTPSMPLADPREPPRLRRSTPTFSTIWAAFICTITGMRKP